MSRVSYFQRFSQKENHATNNTLLAFRYFYQASPLKLQTALTSLLDQELSVGLAFEQQVKGTESIPDAVITQKPLRIYVETKQGINLTESQIEKHAMSIAAAGRPDGDSFLIGLTKEPLVAPYIEKLRQLSSNHGVHFVAVTFSEIVEALRKQTTEYEVDLVAIVDDFEQYLADEQLLEQRTQRMPIFPCGTSYVENKRFGLYYEPVTRPLKLSKYIGLYWQKHVGLVGKISCIVACEYRSDELVVREVEFGIPMDDELNRVTKAILETPYYDISKGHRFYVVDDFKATNVIKSSSGGIMGMRYLDLISVIGSGFNPKEDYSSAKLAELFCERFFE